MIVGVVQTDPVIGSVHNNRRAAFELMSSQHADLYVLPELFTSGYNFLSLEEARASAETADGPTCAAMTDFARAHSCYVVYGFPELSDRLYNSAALVGPDGLVGLYRKVHLFDRENLFFAPGNLGFPVFNLPFGTVGIMICFDWIYPESARSLALRGADLIAHPSNLVLPYCPDAMVTRCLENRVFAATADRVGRENRGGIDLTFTGLSEIVTPKGQILKRLGPSEASIAVAECDLRQAKNKRINGFNDLFSGRRPGEYSLGDAPEHSDLGKS
jgi:5-aminopentanamidase